MHNDTSPTVERPLRRWPGVLLSLFVPGFGLVRAGYTARGIVWFVALQLLSVVVALLAISRSIPFLGVVAGFVIGIAVHLAMLVDSFRPGRLTAGLWAVFILPFLLFVSVPSATSLVARAFTIPTRSMEPTLLGSTHGIGDHIIADRISYLFSPPRRGDLIVFHTTGIPAFRTDTFITNRLIGLPGEKIEIRDGHVFADGRQLGEIDGIPPIPYTPLPTERGASGGTYEVPQDSFFVLGDNPPNSFDSRAWGFLPRANVYGRVARIYYPFSRVSVPR